MRLSFDRVSIDYGSRSIVKDLTFELEGAQTVALMGPSGSGKTSLLTAIAGQIDVTAGRIQVAPSDIVPEWIVQSSPLLTLRDALTNVALGALSRGVGLTEANRRSQAAMEQLNIGQLTSQRASSLSGGERQRVAVARAIAGRSPLILADEPTASLDDTSRSLVCDALAAAASHGSLVLIATHDPEVARRCNGVARLQHGQLNWSWK